MWGKISPAFYLLGFFRKKLLLKGEQGDYRLLPAAFVAARYPVLPEPFALLMGPLENLSQLVPVSFPPIPCFLLPLPPRAYFRLSKLEDTSAIIKATPSVIVEDVSLGRRDSVCSQGCHLPRSTHSSESSDLSFISSAVGFVYLFSPGEVGNLFQACLCCGIRPGKHLEVS